MIRSGPTVTIDGLCVAVNIAADRPLTLRTRRLV